MRGVGYVVSGFAIFALACGSAGTRAPSGQGGTGGGTFPDGGGGAGGTKQPNQQELPAGQTTEPDGQGGSGALGASMADLTCAELPQAPHVLTTTVAGNNTTGSAVEARENLSQPLPEVPIPAHLSAQEFINYYGPSFPPLTSADPVVHVQLQHNPVPKHFDLLVAIQAPPATTRPRVSLTIVVDNTESMGESGLARAKSALRAVAAELVAGDGVQWLTAAPDTQLAAYAISGPDDSALVGAIDALGLESERELGPLIEAAYADAIARHDPSAMNRVLLVSDGADDPATLPPVIESQAALGSSGEIRLSALGTGPARARGHRLLRTASRFGRGAYRYLDDADAAQANLPRFDALFGVALDSVTLELTLPWYFTVERPFVGAVVSSSAVVEPQYVAPGGTMSFLFRLIACSDTAYKDVTVNAPMIEARFSWLSPVDGSPGSAEHIAEPYVLADTMSAPNLNKLLAVASYADALRSLDEKRLLNALALAESDPNDVGLAEIALLLKQHPILAAQ